MSLVGSLEDLGLADILQIVSLSRKSGLLLLRSEAGDARIVLRDGMVRGASVKGESDSLRAVLVDGGFLRAEDFDRAVERAEEEGGAVDAMLAEIGGLAPERLESLRRECVERAVMRMFTWRAGEFSFEIREEVDPQDAELLLPTGINTQYLAIEATRRRDEGTLGRSPVPPIEEEEADEPLFSGESEAGGAPAPGAVETVALAALRQAEDAWSPDPGPAEITVEETLAAPESIPVTLDADEVLLLDAGEALPDGDLAGELGAPADAPAEDPLAPTRPGDASPAAAATPAWGVATAGTSVAAGPAHLVAIDPDLCALEWLKATLEDLYARIHIFQRSEIGLERIRYYLARGVVPAVLVSARAPADPLTGSSDVEQLVRRLRALAPTMPIAVLGEEGRPGPSRVPGADAVVQRPASPGADPAFWPSYADTAERLREALRALAPARRGASAQRASRASLLRLKALSDRLRDPSSQGDVLALVLEYAAECFSRVAIFMLRDDVAAGMVQKGLPAAGGPDDEALRRIELLPDDLPELFRQAVERRAAVRSSLDSPLDRRLADRLGTARAPEAYAAPIESGGCVVAILYGDNLPGGASLVDTTALEIVLHEAGLALDRALLERALADAERR
jgi:Domain of unknown function (DUF4388)